MVDPETSATPEATEPIQTVTDAGPGPAQPNGEAPQAPLEPKVPDWREAFEAQQKATSRVARRLEETQSTNKELVEAIKIIRTQQEAIAKATLPPEQAEALIAQVKGSEDGQRQKHLVDQASLLVNAQQRLLRATIEQAGLDPKSIDWADDAASVDEWTDRVHASIQKEIGKSRDGLLRSVDKAVQTRTRETEAKLKDEQRKALKEAGVDKIDTAQGTPSSFAERLARLDPNSKEFEALTEQALAGRLKGIR